MLIETNARPDKVIPIDNLDFYLCPKNATNTIRYCQYLFNGGTKEIPDFRNEVTSTGAGLGYLLLHLVKGEVTYIPERENSIKIAVVRDPVDRFTSAIRWINFKYDENLTVESALSRSDEDIHLWPQYMFYGEWSKKYDHIIYPEDITSTIKKLTGKDLGDVHKGRNPYPKNFYITSEQTDKICKHYKKDIELGYA